MGYATLYIDRRKQVSNAKQRAVPLVDNISHVNEWQAVETVSECGELPGVVPRSLVNILGWPSMADKQDQPPKEHERKGLKGAYGLRKALKEMPQLFSIHKINAVDREITHLSMLPERYQHVKVLYISRNSLCTLQGIHQFPKLRVLSAAYNPIKHLDAFKLLPEATPELRNASFHGCPVTLAVNYRSHAIVSIPKIERLDGHAVTEKDREEAQIAIKREEVTMNVMIHNACIAHKLRFVCLLIRLHAELRASILYQTGNALSISILNPVRVEKLLDIWEYNDNIGNEGRLHIRNALQYEVSRCQAPMQRALGGGQHAFDMFTCASDKVIQAQQRTIEELKELTHLTQRAAERLIEGITASEVVPLTTKKMNHGKSFKHRTPSKIRKGIYTGATRCEKQDPAPSSPAAHIMATTKTVPAGCLRGEEAEEGQSLSKGLNPLKPSQHGYIERVQTSIVTHDSDPQHCSVVEQVARGRFVPLGAASEGDCKIIDQERSNKQETDISEAEEEENRRQEAHQQSQKGDVCYERIPLQPGMQHCYIFNPHISQWEVRAAVPEWSHPGNQQQLDVASNSGVVIQQQSAENRVVGGVCDGKNSTQWPTGAETAQNEVGVPQNGGNSSCRDEAPNRNEVVGNEGMSGCQHLLRCSEMGVQDSTPPVPRHASLQHVQEHPVVSPQIPLTTGNIPRIDPRKYSNVQLVHNPTIQLEHCHKQQPAVLQVYNPPCSTQVPHNDCGCCCGNQNVGVGVPICPSPNQVQSLDRPIEEQKSMNPVKHHVMGSCRQKKWDPKGMEGKNTQNCCLSEHEDVGTQTSENRTTRTDQRQLHLECGQCEGRSCGRPRTAPGLYRSDARLNPVKNTGCRPPASHYNEPPLKTASPADQPHKFEESPPKRPRSELMEQILVTHRTEIENRSLKARLLEASEEQNKLKAFYGHLELDAAQARDALQSKMKQVEELQMALNHQQDAEQHSVEVLAELKILSDEKDHMHRKLRKERRGRHSAEKRAEMYEMELNTQRQELEREHALLSLASRALQRRAFRQLYIATQASKESKVRLKQAIEMNQASVARRAFHQWCIVVDRAQAMRIMEVHRSAGLVCIALEHWRAYAIHKRKLASRESRADLHYEMALCKRVLEYWHAIAEKLSIQSQNLDRLLPMAQGHWRFHLIQQSFGAWREWCHSLIIVKAAKIKKAQKLFERRLQLYCLQNWSFVTVRRRAEQRLLARTRARFHERILKGIWRSWMDYVDECASLRRLESIADVHFGGKMLRKWKQSLGKLQEMRSQEVQGMQLYDISLCRRVLKGWKKRTIWLKQRQLAVALALRHREVFVLQITLSTWQGFARYHIEQRRQEARKLARKSKEAESRWYFLVESKLADTKKIRLAMGWHRKSMNDRLRRCLSRWQDCAKNSKGRQHMIKLVFLHAETSKLATCFSHWRWLVSRIHRDSAQSMKKMIGSLQQECQGLQIRNTSLQSEQVQVSKSHEEAKLSQSQLRLQANECQEELLLTQDVVLQAQKQERELCKALKEKARQLKDAKVEVKLLQEAHTKLVQKAQSVYGSMDGFEKKAKSKQENLEASIKRLENQTKFLQNELKTAQKDRSCLRMEVQSLREAKTDKEKEIDELTKIKNRWAAGAKEVSQQLELRTREMKRQEGKLAEAIQAREEAKVTIKHLSRCLVTAEASKEGQGEIERNESVHNLKCSIPRPEASSPIPVASNRQLESIVGKGNGQSSGEGMSTSIGKPKADSGSPNEFHEGKKPGEPGRSLEKQLRFSVGSEVSVSSSPHSQTSHLEETLRMLRKTS